MASFANQGSFKVSSRRVLPAEWAPQSAVLLTWPHPGTDWAAVLDDVEPVFLDIARAVLRFEHLVISCEHVVRLQDLERELNHYAATADLPGRVKIVPAPANDTWVRDHGPITIHTDDGPVLLDFRFNAWGGKFPWEKDDALNRHLANAGVFGQTPVQPVDFVLEGGSIESDGEDPAFNLVIANTNNYFVGERGILVHDNTPQTPTRAKVPGWVTATSER